MKWYKHVWCLFALPFLFSSQAWASMAIRLSLDQLIQNADWVVVATLEEEGVSAWDANHLRILTTYRFKVEEQIAGQGDLHFTLVQPGGSVGRWAQITHGYPTFKPGDHILLFLRKLCDGPRVVGLSQGVFQVESQNQVRTFNQRLEGLHFVEDSGEPMILNQETAIRTIQKQWLTKDKP